MDTPNNTPKIGTEIRVTIQNSLIKKVEYTGIVLTDSQLLLTEKRVSTSIEDAPGRMVVTEISHFYTPDIFKRKISLLEVLNEAGVSWLPIFKKSTLKTESHD